MAGHRAGDHTAAPTPAPAGAGAAVWIQPGTRPDPFRAEGVPDRLVLVLHREGLDYVGTLVTWEYRAIEVRRRTGPDGAARVVREMVVGASDAHTVELLVRMHQRPTAARLVAELVDVLRGMVGVIAGRDRRMPSTPWPHLGRVPRGTSPVQPSGGEGCDV